MKKACAAALCLALAAALTGCGVVDDVRSLLTTTAMTQPSTVPVSEAAASTAVTTPAAPAEETTEAQQTETETEPVTEPPITWETLLSGQKTGSVTLTCAVDDADLPVAVWGEDEVSREITYRTGVTLEVGRYTRQEDFLAMLAAGDLPDLIYTRKRAALLENDETSLAWDVLADRYCPELMTLVDPLELLNNEAADGHIYTLRTGYRSAEDYADENALSSGFADAAVSFRGDIAEKLGLNPRFTSFEEFNDLLYAVKEQQDQAKVEYVLNLYPAGYDAFSLFFGCKQGIWWDEKAQSVKTRYRDNTWLTYYKQLNQWYRDGILPKDYLSVRPETFLERCAAGETFALSYTEDFAAQLNQAWRDEEKGGCYDDLTKRVMVPVTGALTVKGEDRLARACADSSIGEAGCFITKDCSAPDRAIGYMAFLKSPEGDRLTQWGIEGTHYSLNEAGLPVRDYAMDARPEEEVAAAYTGIGLWSFQASDRTAGLKAAAAAANEADAYAAHDAALRNEDVAVKKAACEQAKCDALAFARMEKTDDLYGKYTRILDEFSRVSSSMILAESEAEVETLWYGFLAFAKENRLTEIEALMTERFVNALWRYENAGYYTEILQ